MNEIYPEVVLLERYAGEWTRAENNRMFWLVNKAFQFLSDWGLFIHYPKYRADLSDVSVMSWLDAWRTAHALGRTPGHKTVFVCLRAENWWREGLASEIGGDFCLVSYREQVEREGSSWWQMVAHEFLHTLGANDEYFDYTPQTACLMADLAQERLCDRTLREIGR